MSKKAYGTYSIAKICQVAPITIGRWIEEGKLPFFTTGGGHRRVWDRDLIKFLKAHNYPIPRQLQAAARPVALIVDDEANIRRILRRALEKNIPGIDIHEAADGFEAGQLVASLTPNVVILDLLLPGIDGVSVCQKIRKNDALRNVSVIAITGQADEGVRDRVLRAGADHFLQKPFPMDELAKLVKAALPA